MELRISKSRRNVRISPPYPCAQCGALISSPEWSESIDEYRVKHLWECEACGCNFETLACFPRPQRPKH
jgi:DNA-directed RNA polymerase subunit RPC12/RpoP